MGRRPGPQLLLALVLLAASVPVAGCGSADRQAAAETAPADEIVAVIEPAPPADPNAPLPPGACFESTAGYGLSLVVDGGASPALCERIARFLPAEAGRAPWPLPASHHEDESTPTLECAVARNGVRVEVLTWPVDESLPGDPYDICSEMVRSGWELQPLFPLGEELGSDAEAGTCFVATERYEVAVTGETERGQALCQEVAARHLPAPIARVAVPVAYPEALGDTVCEASRRGERVRIVSMPGDRGAVDLASVCDSLERGGWKVVRRG